MSSNLKVKISEIDKTWLNIWLGCGSEEMILEASAIACSPIYDLINAVIYSCIYGDSTDTTFDAEGVLYKLKLTPQDKELKITASFIKPKNSIDMPGNTTLDESIEFNCTLLKDDALISFWRGIKEYYAKTDSNLNDISTIETAVTKIKANK
jgi:hypothetical protein